MAMRPFAGGKCAHDAIMAGQQTGHAASGHWKKAQKKITGCTSIFCSNTIPSFEKASYDIVDAVS